MRLRVKSIRSMLVLPVLFAFMGCAGHRAMPPETSTQGMLQSASPQAVFVIPKGLPEWQRRLLVDVNSQLNELESLRVFVQLELSTIDRGQIRNDFPVPLDLSEFYSIQAHYAKDMAFLAARHRSHIYAFYGNLAQINTYLLQREALPYQPYSNVPQRIKTLDQFILSEIAAARAADFSWVK